MVRGVMKDKTCIDPHGAALLLLPAVVLQDFCVLLFFSGGTTKRPGFCPGTKRSHDLPAPPRPDRLKSEIT